MWTLENSNVCAQLCATLCDPMDRSPPGSSVCGILPRKNTETGCHFLLQGIFPPRIKPVSLVSPALAGRFFITEPPGKPGELSELFGDNKQMSQGKENVLWGFTSRNLLTFLLLNSYCVFSYFRLYIIEIIMDRFYG